MVKLAKEIHALDFDARLAELEEAYAEAMASVKVRLEHKDPFTLAEEIKGAKFTSKRRFNQYIFVPSYFLHRHNIICYDETTFLLVYNINAKELLDTVKSLSDELFHRQRALLLFCYIGCLLNLSDAVQRAGFRYL